MPPPSCWVITDGKAGMESQCLGLAEALGLVATVKRTRLRSPWRQLSPTLLRKPNSRAISVRGDAVAPPWPDLLIASGRQSVLPSLLVRELAGVRTFRVQIQNPTIDPALFDLVVVPRHDRLRGDNVVATRGALHRVNAQRLDAARAEFGPRLGALPMPRIAVLLGGDSDTFRFRPERAARLADELAAMVRRDGGSLMVTPSRRTPPDCVAVVRERLAAVPGEVWDGSGANPYFGYLAFADAVVATEDSVNMISEGAATGKPLLLAALDGGSAKFRRFRDSLEADGIARPFAGRIEGGGYVPFDDMERVAAEIRRRLAARAA